MKKGKSLSERRSFPYALLFVLLLPATSGCGSVPKRQGWGSHATLLPSRSSIGAAARKALLDPYTWAPLGVAATLSIDDWDEEVSEWAIDETPIFGSVENARDWSDGLRDSLLYAAIGSTLAADSGSEMDTWLASKAKGGAIGALSFSLTGTVTDSMKDMVGRERPDASNDRSTPSRHAGLAMSYARWSSVNLDYIRMPDRYRGPTRFGLMSTAFLTGWARVEGANHYPMDVFLGFALGNFLTRFTQEAFLGISEDVEFGVSYDLENEALLIGFTWSP